MAKSSSSPLASLGVAMFGIAMFAVMDALMKTLSLEMGVYNAMFWRVSIGLIIATILFFWGGVVWPAKSVAKLHLWRAVVTVPMAFLFFWGLMYVPLAEAIGLSFIAPLIALYLAAVLLEEKIGRSAIIASLIGFSGALVIIGGRLSGGLSEDSGWGVAAILLSAVLYAYNLILQRQQAIVAKPIEIAFFQNATVVAIYLLFAPFYLQFPPQTLLLSLIAAGALGVFSLMLLSWAYARAEAKVLIPVEYSAFIWAALLGWLVFAETITLAVLVGTALIVIGCLVAGRQQPKQIDHIETTVA